MPVVQGPKMRELLSIRKSNEDSWLKFPEYEKKKSKTPWLLITDTHTPHYNNRLLDTSGNKWTLTPYSDDKQF